MLSSSVTHHPLSLSRYWLLLGVLALAIAGLFSLVLVIARTPSLSDIPLFTRLFHEALVVHVDLSVLVWFLSIACLMWSLLASSSLPIIPCLEEAALISFALGTLAIAVSPVDQHGEALMSNYIPVITSPLFFLGLALIMCGVGLMLIRVIASKRISPFEPLVKNAIEASAFTVIVAFFTFLHGYIQMPGIMKGQEFYELLFWGGGHFLQFTHTFILMACWILLIKSLDPFIRMPEKLFDYVLKITVLAILGAFIWSKWKITDITSMEYREFFTSLMAYFNSLAPAALALYLLSILVKDGRKDTRNTLWSALVMSIILFLYGGALGEMIRGQNVVIPAHYHGSIVGITLGFMGAAYLFLPAFGYRDVRSWKLAFWQPIIYGGGQMLHISGLAWSGGYGVLRKTPGGMDALSSSVKVAMGLMGLGGLIAIIGGFLFVIVVGRSVLTKK